MEAKFSYVRGQRFRMSCILHCEAAAPDYSENPGKVPCMAPRFHAGLRPAVRPAGHSSSPADCFGPIDYTRFRGEKASSSKGCAGEAARGLQPAGPQSGDATGKVAAAAPCPDGSSGAWRHTWRGVPAGAQVREPWQPSTARSNGIFKRLRLRSQPDLRGMPSAAVRRLERLRPRSRHAARQRGFRARGLRRRHLHSL